MENVTATKFFVIRNERDAQGHYLVDDVSATSSVDTPLPYGSLSHSAVTVAAPDGRLLRRLPAGTSFRDAVSGLPRGLYIVNGVAIATQ